LFGKVTVAISDAYFVVEPAAAVIVSANSHLRTASGGAHDVTRIAGRLAPLCCKATLTACPKGPRGSPTASSR